MLLPLTTPKPVDLEQKEPPMLAVLATTSVTTAIALLCDETHYCKEVTGKSRPPVVYQARREISLGSRRNPDVYAAAHDDSRTNTTRDDSASAGAIRLHFFS